MRCPLGLKLLFFSLICFSSAVAQDNVWSLQRCIEYARAHNIQIKQQALEKQRAEISLQQSRLSQLPQVNGSANYGKNFGRSIDPTTNQFVGNELSSAGVDLSAGVTLFNFFQIRNTIKANKYRYKAGDAILKKMVNDISLNVANAYLQILMAEEQVKTSKQQVSLTLNQLGNTVKQVEAGVLPESNIADLQAQLARDSATLVSNQNQVQNAILQMKVLLNLDFHTPFVPQKPELETIPLINLAVNSPEAIYRSATQQQPGIIADSLLIASSKHLLEATRAQLYPSLSLGARLGTNYSSSYRRPVGEDIIHVPPAPIGNVTINGNEYVVQSLPQDVSTPKYEDPSLGTQLNDNLRESVALSLSIPLFNGWQTRAQIKNAKIDLENQKLTLQNDLLTLKQDIYTAYFEAEAALKNYNAARKTLEATEKSFFYAKKRYEVGLINSLEYLTTQNNLFKAQNDLIANHYDYIFKMKVLEFYKNLSISL